jgi:hypothetical protein
METNRQEVIEAIQVSLSDITCGEACWHAKELVCRCSCGGKNHGCLKTADGVMPIRTCKLDGVMYELTAVGEFGQLYGECKKINDQYPKKPVPYPCEKGFIVYPWGDNDYNAPARLKPSNACHINRWPELSAYKELPAYKKPYILWKRCLLNQESIKVA